MLKINSLLYLMKLRYNNYNFFFFFFTLLYIKFISFVSYIANCILSKIAMLSSSIFIRKHR